MKISQFKKAKEMILQYIPRSLSSAERNYSVTEKDALSVVNFVKYYYQLKHVNGSSDRSIVVSILTAIHYFSCHLHVIPVLDIKPETLLKVFVKEYCFVFGFTSIVSSDHKTY